MMRRRAPRTIWDERAAVPQMRDQAARAFSRAAGAPLVDGNSVRILKDAGENFPAWLAVIRGARRHIHFESYFIVDDATGREFAEALSAKAREGVQVRVIYDWFGNFGKARNGFWQRMRDAGVEVRCYNPPRFDSPFAWPSRDHRKMLEVDGEVAFISGLCVGDMWLGDPKRGIAPWRDTGVEIRGSAVAEVWLSFARAWSSMGSPLPEDEIVAPLPAGDVSLRIVASEPATAGMLRLDQLVAALARQRLWLTDAYYAGTSSYVQALRSAARDGVDVRLLVPGATDIPLLRPLTRSGYRPLLEAGVRVFEWNGTMLHAKTAVMDDRWARVGSTNLNIASWLGNCELDAVVEDTAFAGEMAHMYEEDLGNATEIVLDSKRRMRAPNAPPVKRAQVMSGGGGSTSRAAAGAMRLGRAVGAALSNRRVLDAVEARLTLIMGLALALAAFLIALFPEVLAYPLAAIAAWVGVALLYRAYRLHRDRKR